MATVGSPTFGSMSRYEVRYGVLEGDDIPDVPNMPRSGAHVKQMHYLRAGASIRNPLCYVYSDRHLVCIDRPSRAWMAKAAGTPLPVFISDFTSKYSDWPIIATATEALKYIKDVPMKGPFFHYDGFIYRAP